MRHKGSYSLGQQVTARLIVAPVPDRNKTTRLSDPVDVRGSPRAPGSA